MSILARTLGSFLLEVDSLGKGCANFGGCEICFQVEGQAVKAEYARPAPGGAATRGSRHQEKESQEEGPVDLWVRWTWVVGAPPSLSSPSGWTVSFQGRAGGQL